MASAAGGTSPGSARPEKGNKAAAKKESAGMQCGTIGHLRISRLILGSNVMGGGAHARDLGYVSRLMKAYNTEERILSVLELAESEGINTVLQGNVALIRKYNTERGGNLRQILPLRISAADDRGKIKQRMEAQLGETTAALYVFGDSGDYLARDQRVDVIGTALELASELGILLGVGGHSLQVVLQCEQQGLKPDFYVKTFHSDDYWSATPKENREPFCWYDNSGGNSYSGKTNDHNRFHDNIWCLDPEKTTEVMSQVEVPWIAYKVLAAGAIPPLQGFEYAFERGADFIAVGMLDFQIREDARIARDCLGRLGKRSRPWRA